MRSLAWILVAVSLPVLVIGGVEWLKGRGGQLLVAGVSNFAMALVLALGDGYAVVRYILLAVVGLIAACTFVRLRAIVHFSRPPLVFGLATCLLIGAIELIPGVPAAVVRLLPYGVVVFGALFIISSLWHVEKSRRAAGANTGSTTL